MVNRETYVEKLRQVGGGRNCGHNDKVGSGGGGEGRGEEGELHDCDVLRSELSL